MEGAENSRVLLSESWSCIAGSVLTGAGGEDVSLDVLLAESL